MRDQARSQSSKRPTPAEQAETFKAAQEQMKQDAARRRLEADEAKARKTRKR